MTSGFSMVSFTANLYSTTCPKTISYTIYEKGLCNTDIRPGIFRRKSSSSRSRLSVVQSSSCPTSPRQGVRYNNSSSSLRNFETSSSVGSRSSTSDIMPGLHRSASSISTVGRPRSSPSGLFSYTGELVVFVSQYRFRLLICVIYFMELNKVRHHLLRKDLASICHHLRHRPT